MSITNLLETYHNKLLRAQAVERIINSDEFRSCYDAASETQRLAVEILINNFDPKKVREWVYNNSSLHDKPVRALREEAQRLGIGGTSKMNKLQIINAIENRRVHGCTRDASKT